MTLWPGLLKRESAAKYCDMKPAEFDKAVASGDLPSPIMVNGKHLWRRADIDALEPGNPLYGWRDRSALYAKA
jgi:hypothetical protein